MRNNYFKQIIKVLEDLHKEFPSLTLGKHLSTALDGHNIWGMTDRDILTCLKDYKSELEIDVIHNESVEDIIKGGMKLNDILEEDSDDEEY